ncbi:MAG TPA: SDR family NAD(P)-dependent oxidoreductase, partial [Gammaproteobacteria bacterium]|nr:SDR family NAD(P)-dependent oxidoreductase [Gammaproteobacteria bacterium]
MQLQDTVTVITGGASGLGAAAAQHLASLGAKVVIFDVSEEGVQRVAKQVNGLGVVCDVTDEQSVKNAFALTKKQYGPARVCVNFAGILDGGRIIAKDGPMDLNHFRNVIDIDLIGTFNVMRIALADMIECSPIGEAEERGVVI